MISAWIAFIPQFLIGFLLNLEIGVVASILGLIGGMPLALIRQRLPWLRPIARVLVSLMQAAPVYVVMFFLLNLLPDELRLGGTVIQVDALAAVIGAQAVYMTAYVADAGLAALEAIRRGSRSQALLFLPALLRGFMVIVMSSGLAAAIGLAEAVGVTLQASEMTDVLPERLGYFGIAIAWFVVFFGTANALLARLVARLSHEQT